MTGIEVALAMLAGPGVLLTTGIWCAAVLLEFWWGTSRGRLREDWQFDLLSAALIACVSRPLAALLAAGALAALAPDWRGRWSDCPLWLAFAVVFGGDELLHYWYHRCAHRWGWLWRIHQAHHSPDRLCAAMAYRDHAAWFLLAPNVWWSAGMLYLGLADGYACSIAVIGVWNVINHLHFPIDRWLERGRCLRVLRRGLGWIWVLPSAHHAHHGLGPGSTPQGNFAPTLAIWDGLFGTRADAGQPARFGLRTGGASWLELLWWPWRASRRP